MLESLRFLLAPQQEVDERQQLDPFQWAQKLYKYRELPHIMTPWKEECSPETEQRVYQVDSPCLQCIFGNLLSVCAAIACVFHDGCCMLSCQASRECVLLHSFMSEGCKQSCIVEELVRATCTLA